MIKPQIVLDFWFTELSAQDWFRKDSAIDAAIKNRFEEILEKAKRAELFAWRENHHGRLAEIILLDQFSRNIYRDSGRAFEADSLALALAQEMVSLRLDELIRIEHRAFCYMPYMHSESRVIHEEAMKLFTLPGLENNLKFEVEHKKIIDRFGRYPHRNKLLGRKSTAEELEFLVTHSGF